MPRLSKILHAAVAATSLVVASPASSAVLLGSTTIEFSASGSPNSIGGNWSSTGLDIVAGQHVDYFTLEVVRLESAFGEPDSFSFSNFFPSDSRSIGFGLGCPVGISCVGLPTVGAISLVDILTTAQPQARDFLFRLDPDDLHYATRGSVTVTYPRGGGTAAADGAVLVKAFGTDSRQLPEPGTIALVCLALFGLVMSRRQ